MAGSLAHDDLGRAEAQAGMGDAGDDGDVGVDGPRRVRLDEVGLEEDLLTLQDKPVRGHDGGDLAREIPAVIGHREQGHRAGRDGRFPGDIPVGRRGRKKGGVLEEFAPFHAVNTFLPERAMTPRAKFAASISGSGMASMTAWSLFSELGRIPPMALKAENGPGESAEGFDLVLAFVQEVEAPAERRGTGVVL